MHYSKHSQKTQSSSSSSERQTVVFLIGVSLALILSFLLLVPKVSSSLFPFKRTLVWNEFIKSVKTSNKIDEQTYWKFREFYSPGYFNFNAHGLDPKQLSLAKEVVGPETKLATSSSAILFFTSKRLYSIDYLTDLTALPQDYLTVKNGREIIFKDQRGIIYKERDTYTIIFLKNLPEMRRANGYFEYDGRDKDLIEGKHWLNITVLQRS